MQFASLGSGSKGNATLVSDGDAGDRTRLMVDCGFSIKEICKRLDSLKLSPRDLGGILVTHEHSDHIRGVAPLAGRYEIPVYASRGTAQYFQNESINVEIINVHKPLSIGSMEIEPVPVPHDAREPCQYIFRSQSSCFGLLTDLGSVTPHVIESYTECDAILLEFNHDSDMLEESHYPASVRKRVAGNLGHLNNSQAGEFLGNLLPGNLKLVVAGHLSESNNSTELVNSVLQEVIGSHECDYYLANQHKTSQWYQLA